MLHYIVLHVVCYCYCDVYYAVSRFPVLHYVISNRVALMLCVVLHCFVLCPVVCCVMCAFPCGCDYVSYCVVLSICMCVLYCVVLHCIVLYCIVLCCVL